ncbi:DUF1593 domain-containing protein [Bacteroidota bacterium]
MKSIRCNKIVVKKLVFLTLVCLAAPIAAQIPRVIVTTDGEIDDKSSFVRYLMYSNEFDTEGLIYSNSVWQKHGHGTTWMQETIDAWAEIRPNLAEHMTGYPTPESLKAVCFAGNMDEANLNDPGPLETEGARHIISVLLKYDPRPVWILAWGGTNTIAQALSLLEQDHTDEEVSYAHNKMRIYAVADQDETAKWIRENYPHIFYIQCHQFMALNYQHAGHPYSEHHIFSDEWMTENVKSGHGPLGAMYPQSYFSEGDSPSFFHLIGNGLRSAQNPTWGGWGGRFMIYGRSHYYSDANDDGDRLHGQWIWLLDIQEDFAARMDWCVKSYKEANHYPMIKGKIPEEVIASPGEEIQLKVKKIKDPDGDELTVSWEHYHFAGENPYAHKIDIQETSESQASIKIPEDAGGKELHIILTVVDNGTPMLKRYKRVVVKVE